MKKELPKRFRPDTDNYRKVDVGVDVPSAFYDALKGLDENLFLVWHDFDLIWESIVQNEYTGSEENPRYRNQVKFGKLCFGQPRVNPDGAPVPDNRWHIWRLCTHGWAHVMPIASTQRSHLDAILENLFRQARVVDKYGARVYNQQMAEEGLQGIKKNQDDHRNMFHDISTENKHVMKEVAENLARGHTAPTDPTKKVITSYSGQTNRGDLEVPIDENKALYLPED